MILTIEPKGEKGRAFSADCIAHATADALWVDATTNNTRPIWAVFAGPSEQLRAFGGNLRLGNIAKDGAKHGDKFEFQRSAPYRWWTRPLPAGGSVLTVAHPSLLGWRCPSEESYRYQFAILPALAWLAAQRFDVARATDLLDRLIASSLAAGIAVTTDRADYSVYPTRYTYKSAIYTYKSAIYTYKSAINVVEKGGESLEHLLGYGALLLHYLDHRLPLPIPRDPVFGAWLILVSQYGRGPILLSSRAPYDVRRSFGYEVATPGAAGCAAGLMFTPRRLGVSGEGALKAVSAWLGTEVQRWFSIGGV